MNNLLYGKKPLLDLIKMNKDKVILVHLLNNNNELIKLLKTNKISFKVHYDKKYFNQYGEQINHQFVVTQLKSSSNKFNSLDEFLIDNKNSKYSIIVVLDEIQDIRNFGAILRTCYGLDIDAVIYKSNNQAPLNPLVSKTSLGAVENVNIFKVTNLSNTIDKLKQHGYWIYASTLNNKSIDLDQIKFDKKTVIIIGNEDKGISKLLIDKSDFNVKIPMSNNLQSLNVSVALGILLYAIKMSIK